VSPVKYELFFCISEDGILRTYRRVCQQIVQKNIRVWVSVRWSGRRKAKIAELGRP
jgi:hypothetical protein